MFSLGQVLGNTVSGARSTLKPLLNLLQERASAWHEEANMDQGISGKGKSQVPVVQSAPSVQALPGVKRGEQAAGEGGAHSFSSGEREAFPL